MHAAVIAWVVDAIRRHPGRRRVVDLGGRDVNGSVRGLFPGVAYTAVDIRNGPGVDVVADAATWRPEEPPDLVLCLEVLEHAPKAREIVTNALRMLAPGGVLILTCATAPRKPHSGFDGGELRAGEWYRNVLPTTLLRWLTPCPSVLLEVDRRAGDLRAVAVKG